MKDTGTHPPPRLPRFVRWPLIAAAALMLLWALAWLAVPPLVKAQAEQRLSALLGREVSIGSVDFSPWTLALTVERLVVGAASGAANREAQFSVERIHVNADLRSLLRLAPVIEAVDIDGPQLRLTRLADGRNDIDDLLARLQPQSVPANGYEPARFALVNLRLTQGAIRVDDQTVQRQHRVEGLQLSLPFLSNLPADLAVTVEPRLAFTLNGTAFDSGAQAKPFAQDRAAQLELRFADLDLAPWQAYLPAGLPVRPSRGLLAGNLQIQFALAPDGTPRVTLKGQAGWRDGALVSGSGAGQLLATWRALQVGLADVQPLARRIGLGQITLDDTHLMLRRSADGSLAVLPARGAAAAARPASSAATASTVTTRAAPAGSGWRVSVEQITLAGARVDWHDAATQPAASLRADALEFSVQALRWPFEAAVPLALSGRIAPLSVGDGSPPTDAAIFKVQGQTSDRAAQLMLDVQALDLRWLAPYLAAALAPSLEGRAALSTTLDWAAGEQPRLALSKIEARVDGLRLTEAGDAARGAKAAKDAKRNPATALAVASIALADSSVDLVARRVQLGNVKLERPSLRVHRNREGAWNLLAWSRPENASQTRAAASDIANPKPNPTAVPAWQVQVDDAHLNGGELRLHDEFAAGSAGEPVQLVASGVNASLRGLTWPGAALARTQLQLRVAADPAGIAMPTQVLAKNAASIGRIEWNGQLATTPLRARGTLRVERVPVHLFEPYFGSGLNLDLLRAEASWRGDVAVAQRSGGIEASARGDAALGDVRVHERLAREARGPAEQGDELLSWQSLALNGLQFVIKPGSKPRLDIKDAALTDFYSRLVITEQGGFNLRDVAAAPGASASAASSASSAPAAAATGGSLPIDIRIGGTQLVNGKVDFSDRFIKLNYSAALSELNGRLGPFDSASRDMATLELRGRAAGTALLEISGALNPTAQPLALDIRAKATDLELAPLSPYAGRYAGYAIERGKLSMDIAYKIDPDGKLDAKNQVILNQLTFGDKIDSPDATKLPVLLAVALLKDRNGVIEINLPVSGSINDPQFSVFGIVLKIIGNLLVKAFTAPFALLAGGGSDDLSFVGFDPGTASLTESGRATIDKVAKALTDRPALKMTVTGASDPVSEREAAQRAALDARVRAEQRRDALRAGAAADAALPALTAAQREPLIKRLYNDSKLPNKPRNLIGLAKDLPVAEMETLLRNATLVTTDTARELALQRGLAVRDALIAKGLPSERLFLAAPKLRASGEDDAAWTPRVQLALGTD